MDTQSLSTATSDLNDLFVTNTMTDFTKCPSCSTQAIPYKDGSVRFEHKTDCKMGRLRRNQKPGRLGSEREDLPSDTLLCTCGAYHTNYIPYSIKSYAKDSEWKAINECPVCWVRELAHEQVQRL